jgi:hypothetical protein
MPDPAETNAAGQPIYYLKNDFAILPCLSEQIGYSIFALESL